MQVCTIIVCYASANVVRASVGRALAMHDPDVGKIILVDNHSPDPATREYIAEVGRQGAAVVIDAGRNLGCHRGFNLGFEAAMNKFAPAVLIKHDDDMLCPDDPHWEEEMASLVKTSGIVFAGTNFFSDDRLESVRPVIVRHVHNDRRFTTEFVPWTAAPNLPVAAFDAAFMHARGYFGVAYRNASGAVICDNSHLYGGEEADIAAKARAGGYSYGYARNVKSSPIANEALDPDYMLWKYVYGYLGTYAGDFESFRKDKRALRAGYAYWLDKSDNGMHQKWATEYFAKHKRWW